MIYIKNALMPSDCTTCVCLVEYTEEDPLSVCGLTSEEMDYFTIQNDPRPEWCPLKEVENEGIKKMRNDIQWVQEHLDAVGGPHKGMYIEALERIEKVLAEMQDDEE